MVAILVVVLASYGLVAYILVPMLMERYATRHPELEDVPRVTRTREGTPGDPLNVALVGTRTDLERAMLASGWYPADPITLGSSLRIAEGTVFHRPYDHAPVSSLYLFGRKEDLAFEQPVGGDPVRRHHVRLWKLESLDDGRPVWIGAATFDESVGVSHETGEITHHISGDVDLERDHLMRSLESAGGVVAVETIPGFHAVAEGRNGGGDRWHTDGALLLGMLRDTSGTPPPAQPAEAAILEDLSPGQQRGRDGTP